MIRIQLLLSPELGRNVANDDLLLLFVLDALLFPLHLIVLPEVRNIFRVYQVLFASVLIMISFEMVYLVFILVVSVVARSKAKVW